jgi:metal-sulfur cluster biosynthetic enzyme
MNLMERLHQKLKEVNDPGTNMDVMTMRLVRKLEATGDGAVTLEFKPSSPECPLVVPLAFKIRKAVEEVEGVSCVTIIVVDHCMADAVTTMVNEK